MRFGIAIIKKRLNLPRSVNENLQLLSLTLCGPMPLDELLANIDIDRNQSDPHSRMNLFDFGGSSPVICFLGDFNRAVLHDKENGSGTA